LDASPAAGAVVRDDGLEYLQQCGLVDWVATVDLQARGCLVAVSLVDDAVRVAHGGVVDEDVDAILGCEQGAYIAVKHEVGDRLHPTEKWPSTTRIRDDVVTAGGFTQFRRVAETPFNLVFEARS
jgi:hypothetical protein